MKRLRRWLPWLFPVFALLGIIAAIYWTPLTFRLDLHRLSVDAAGTPSFPAKSEHLFGADTFTDNISSAGIADLYYAACERLDHLRGSYPRKTYRYHDIEGYPGVISVVQFPSAHLSVTVFSGNDADSVYLRLLPGNFPPPPNPFTFLELQELPNDRIPKGTLRFEQPEPPGS